ncbi:hypothetical protein [Lacticaseibacillus sharpeae]|uniref:hypothetical protein n=1 Tax=Lacticaseibacillus sharpeae TaxID=1626 RepID=UPI0006CFD4CD|nr:hypothetical protein [Lacticaseibacillus sharpeae]
MNPATVTVTSKAVYGVTNQFDGVMPADDDGNLVTDAAGNATIDRSKLSGRAGDLVVYTFGVSAPKKAAGQAYLAEGTPVQVAYMLPKGLTFMGVDNSTQKPDSVVVDANGNTTLRFYFAAPSIADQVAATTNLVSKQFNVLARIDADTPFNTVLTTQAIMGATSINGQEQSPIANSTIKTVPDMSKLGFATDGETFYFYNWGPRMVSDTSPIIRRTTRTHKLTLMQTCPSSSWPGQPTLITSRTSMTRNTSTTPRCSPMTVGCEPCRSTW